MNLEMLERADYTAAFIRFVRMPLHAEAYQAAYLDQSGASTSELERLHREYETRPPRHDGWCVGECPSEHCGLGQVACAKRGHFHSACLECRKRRNDTQAWLQSTGAEIRSVRIEPPMPMTLMLDLERALNVLGPRESSGRIAQWLSEGV